MVHIVNKGKAGEREACKFLQPAIDEVYKLFPDLEVPQLERNLDQSMKGGYDIKGLPWLALEIKRQEQLNLNKWWGQVNKAARPGQLPVVMYRQNRKKWKFHTFGSVGEVVGAGVTTTIQVRATYEAEDFLLLFKNILFRWVENGAQNYYD